MAPGEMFLVQRDGIAFSVRRLPASRCVIPAHAAWRRRPEAPWLWGCGCEAAGGRGVPTTAGANALCVAARS